MRELVDAEAERVRSELESEAAALRLSLAADIERDSAEVAREAATEQTDSVRAQLQDEIDALRETLDDKAPMSTVEDFHTILSRVRERLDAGPKTTESEAADAVSTKRPRRRWEAHLDQVRPTMPDPKALPAGSDENPDK